MRTLTFLLTFFLQFSIAAQDVNLMRVEPPEWWIGFKKSDLQLLVYGKNISSATVTVDYPGFTLKRINKVSNPNYLFLDLTVSAAAKPGIAPITFRVKGKEAGRYLYKLNARSKGSAARKGFSSSDVIYLLMPDRFANGDPTNDNVEGMTEKIDRTNPNGRHGGDIKGIADHLDYIKNLGATAIWINPLLENNQVKYSYHGYSTTDYYKIDPRFGTNDDYVKLSAAIHQKGMKLIMDQIFNHCGSMHWWMKDLPSPDWVNQWPELTRSTFRAGSVTDPYASFSDSTRFVKGWFDVTMPDLNQHNPYLKNYLIQNSIWWIEYAGLDGIRQDTYPYPFKDMMAEWGKRVLEEYPEFNIVGECWINYPATVAYWQKDAMNKDGYNSWLPSVFDFPLYDALNKTFNEKEEWNSGIVRLYEILSQDFVYRNPSDVVIFAENHDVNRYLDSQNDDIRKLKMAMAFILTTRGIPQIYYGSEVLMTTGADKGDGMKRKDFPGGWPGDKVDLFSAEGRNDREKEMYNYLSGLLQWRKTSPVIHTGHLRHFIPKDGIYTYFRFNSKETVMVVLNNNDEMKKVATAPYDEFIRKHKTAVNVITKETLSDLAEITVPAKSAVILELK